MRPHDLHAASVSTSRGVAAGIEEIAAAAPAKDDHIVTNLRRSGRNLAFAILN